MRIFILFLLLLNVSCIFAFNGRVVNKKGQPVTGADVLIKKADSTISNMAITDSLGLYTIKVEHYPVYVVIRRVGYKTVNFSIKTAPEGRVETVLEDETTALNEVIVTPEMMQRYDNHTTYHISQKEMTRYPNFALAMNVIPFINVTADGAISYRGNSDIVVLLNGVKISMAEVKALDKSDVQKIEVYENPPARYALLGASAVIDIITKRRMKGGNVAVDLNDSFKPVKGTNNISAFFNTGQSRFSLLLNNDMQHYKKVQTDESLDYKLNGIEYRKIKQGQNSPYRRDNTTVSLGFMTHMQNFWQLNANLSTSFYQYNKRLHQIISYNDQKGQFQGESDLYNHYNNQALNLYFVKMWKGNRQFLTDVTGTLYNTRYSSSYNEWNQKQENTFRNTSAYKSNRRSVLSTMQYTTPWILGSWTFGIKDSYQFGKQMQSTGKLVQDENTLYAFSQLYGHKEKLYYQFIAAAKYLNIRQDDHTTWSKWYPSPTISLWYTPIKALTAQMGYTFTANVPSVSLMSETEQWLDNHYVYKGNANLKPYKNHQLWLMTSLVTNHLNVSALGLFNYTPNAIINYFAQKDNYILQSYDNLRFTNEIGGQLVIDYFPLKDKSLKLNVVGIYIHHHGKEETGNSWNGYRYQFMMSASYSLKKWFFEAFYQYPGQTMQGQLITPRAEAVLLDVAFRPVKEMSIGIQWNQPFMNGFKEGERTTKGAIIQSNTTTNFRDIRNMVCLKFSYNISFGKHIKVPAQSVKNIDNESGLLSK